MKSRMLTSIFFLFFFCFQALMSSANAQTTPVDTNNMSDKKGCIAPKIAIIDPSGTATNVPNTSPAPPFSYSAICQKDYRICAKFACANGLAPTYVATVTDKDGVTASYTGTGASFCFNHQFNKEGVHVVTLHFFCGNVCCYSVTFYVYVCDCPCNCEGGKLNHINFSAPNWHAMPIECGKGYEFCHNNQVSFNVGYDCAGDCDATYEYLVNGVSTASGSGNAFSQALPTVPGTYVIAIIIRCGKTVCYECKFEVKIVDCNPVDCCGKWENLPDLIGTGIKYEDVCGKGFELKCGKFQLIGNYLCKDTCKATYDVTLYPAVGAPIVITTNDPTLNEVLNFTSNGAYSVTVVVKCGGKICDKCVFKFQVFGCGCECPAQGEGWKKIQLSMTGAVTSVKCGETISAKCNQMYYIDAVYNCVGNGDCAKIKGFVTAPDGTLTNFSGSGSVAVPYTFTQSGLYSLFLQPYCDGKPCPPCRFFIKVDCAPVDCCGQWEKKPAMSGNGAIFPELCGLGFDLKCGKYTLTGVYICKAPCKATYDITVTSASGAIVYSSLNDATLNEVIGFATNGGYLVQIVVKCGGKECAKCAFKVSVQGCLSVDPDIDKNTGLPQGQLRAFPNPTTGQLNLDLPTSTASYQLVLRDLTGKTVLHKQNGSNRESLSLENLPNGTYFLEAISAENRYKTLVVKQ
ncbi:MAG TPA: T9SS type A sorting domain-containing protein [Haliscomenobacter sp.]|uniref:T9SS type A sorting domain-containing protein n=1 Tax=Haliscomenobacter sp. TaxID=2717303 RepID=UPI002CB69976|nr:T9SS type A sorting domain-containing protein [Haliscomenobacter sp.]HOY15859.1 T9SS type A sorting domain-containing protein [Haliscomenobacter sp.]